MSVAYVGAGDIREAARVVAGKVAARFGADWAAREFDVVGISMGGLVARVLASPQDGGPALRIKRLFMLATPHRGAKLARVVAPDRAARDMRPGSDFLGALDARLPSAGYELVCYAQLRDWWVGAGRAAPPGRVPIWTDTESVGARLFSHFQINFNRRVLRDVARRLRGEEPVARGGSWPPCD